MTEVALYETPAAPALPDRVGVPGTQDFDSWVAVASDVIKLATHIADTPFVPDGLRGSAPAVAAAILAGREMGLGPMTSLANIDVIKGRPAPKAVLMRALVQSRGHSWIDVDVTDTRAVVKGRRRGEAEWTEVVFTADQAKKAGIDLGKYPADKLYARASARLCRRRFADCVMGMPYSADEVEDGDIDGDGAAVLELAPAPAAEPKPRTAQRRQREPKADETVVPTPAPGAGAAPAGTAASADARTAPASTSPDLPPLPGEDGPGIDKDAPGSVLDSDGMVTKIQAIYHSDMRFTNGERANVIKATEQIIGRELTGPVEGKTHNNLSWNEARLLIDTLERCGSRDNLIALLAAGNGQADV